MTTTPRAATAAALVVLAVTGTTACQNQEPEPAPTAVLPTPDPRTPTPVPSASGGGDTAAPSQESITAAARSYIAGRVLAEDLYQAGDTDRLEELDEYFTGSYREFWQEDLTDYVDAGIEYEGDLSVSVVLAQNYDSSGQVPTFELVTCLDLSDVEYTDAEGVTIAKPFDTAIEDVTVEESDRGAWLASSARTEPVETFAGTSCEGSFDE